MGRKEKFDITYALVKDDIPLNNILGMRDFFYFKVLRILLYSEVHSLGKFSMQIPLIVGPSM